MSLKNQIFFFPYFLFLSFFELYPQNLSIVEKPIPVAPKERLKLIREYADLHYGKGFIRADGKIEPRFIVIHSTETQDFSSTYQIFNGNRLQGREDIRSGGNYNVGTPFVVDKDGTIYRIFPEILMGRHCIGLNHISIGIENVGFHAKGLSEKQLEANLALVEHLLKKYPKIEFLIGHYEYTDCEKNPFFKEKMRDYRTEKTDPGKDFLQKLRI
ncbi:MAG: N-acetylmuramoyl-L-alanine amidase, partial [Leptospiraceae bacterium]|nr:N-acetylmuramoyl-L-alanine amidase [Leptospiraceae bacterium]